MSELSCSCCCRLSQELDVGGGVTNSVFPRTEMKLNEIFYQKALKFVGKHKRMERYHSMVDFLFCETFPQWRFHAFQYYNDQGPKLKDHPGMVAKELAAYDTVLCELVLELCGQCLEKEMHITWGQFQQQVQKFMFLAVGA